MAKDDAASSQNTFGWTNVPTPPPDETFFAITGHESQVLTVRLIEGNLVRVEPGTMFYLTEGMNQTLSCDQCFERALTGESCCTVNVVNDGSIGRTTFEFAALTPKFPTAKVVPVDLSSPAVGGTLIAQKGAYMASYGDVRVKMSLDLNFMRCCCGGMGLVRQKLVGPGTVFLASTGTMVQKVLAKGETILVDTHCLLAFAGSCKMDLRKTGGVLGMTGGGEGIFNTTITGPGLVIMQSMNEIVFRQAMVPKLWRR